MHIPEYGIQQGVALTEGRRPSGVRGLDISWWPETEPEKESARWFRGFGQGRELVRASPGQGWSLRGTVTATSTNG